MVLMADGDFVQPMTQDEYAARQFLAVSLLNEVLITSWFEHQDWCAFTQSALECTCGAAAYVWFSGPTRLVGVGFDMHPHVYDKH